jgi:hypothetical protein
VHQWQALLRSLSGYEPYRRAYDARIIPSRVLEFVLQREDFPRSLTCTLRSLQATLSELNGTNPLQVKLAGDLDRLLKQISNIDPHEIARSGSFEHELHWIEERCEVLSVEFETGFFTTSRPASQPITAAPGAALVPQQQQQQQQHLQQEPQQQRRRRPLEHRGPESRRAAVEPQVARSPNAPRRAEGQRRAGSGRPAAAVKSRAR